MNCPKCGAKEHESGEDWMCGSWLETEQRIVGFDDIDERQVFTTGENCFRNQIAALTLRAARAEAKLERVREWNKSTGYEECTCSTEYVAIKRTDPSCRFCDEEQDRMDLDAILNDEEGDHG